MRIQSLVGSFGSATLVLALSLVPFQPVIAQSATDSAGVQSPAEGDGGPHATRQGLKQLLQRFERTAASGADGDMRARARFEAALIRTRLSTGDYRVGDQVTLTVEGEDSLSDTFAVATGRVLVLPMIGEIPLEGVLRSELEAHLTEHIGRFVRDPVVRAQSLMRMSIIGEVSSPGFYVVSSEVPLTDLLMQAGGPTEAANITDIRVERGEEEIWGGEPLQAAITEGRTLDQLNLRAGDRIVVPDQGWDWGTARNVILTISGLIGLGAAIF